MELKDMLIIMDNEKNYTCINEEDRYQTMKLHFFERSGFGDVILQFAKQSRKVLY